MPPENGLSGGLRNFTAYSIALRRQIKGYLDEAGKAQSQVSELKREVVRLQQRLDSRGQSWTSTASTPSREAVRAVSRASGSSRSDRRMFRVRKTRTPRIWHQATAWANSSWEKF